MADKEERIFIAVLGDRCCPVLSNDNICVLDYDCDDCKAGMTRQEAIESMAKALHSRSTAISDIENDWGKLDERWRDSFCKYSEAALNALLENKK